MSLKLNTQAAKAADTVFASISESGKYVGTITRAEKILSEKGTIGLGISFKSNDGATADYLDMWYQAADGKELTSIKQVMALLACLKLREPTEGQITFEGWDKQAGAKVKKSANGYPEMMGKQIGILLQKELSTYNGKDKDKVIVFGFFQADTELTASEVLSQKTNPEQLEKMLTSLMSRPVRDNRANKPQGASSNFIDGHPVPVGNDDIPW